MGLFDGAADGHGSTADLASLFDLPVILVVDARGMAASAAAWSKASPAIATMSRWPASSSIAWAARRAQLRCAAPATTALLSRFGCLPDDPRLELPKRHLG